MVGKDYAGVTVCDIWQAYLQMIVLYISKGYSMYCQVHYPLKKKDKWSQIDDKLSTKYGTTISRYQRARRRKTGKAVHVIVRWQGQGVILRTPGALPEYEDPDVFVRIETPIMIEVSELLQIQVTKSERGKVQVHLERECYRGWKDQCLAAVVERAYAQIYYSYNRMNGVPAYGGIIAQRRSLKRQIEEHTRKHGVPIDAKKLRVGTYRRIYKIRSLSGGEGTPRPDDLPVVV